MIFGLQNLLAAQNITVDKYNDKLKKKHRERRELDFVAYKPLNLTKEEIFMFQSFYKTPRVNQIFFNQSKGVIHKVCKKKIHIKYLHTHFNIIEYTFYRCIEEKRTFDVLDSNLKSTTKGYLLYQIAESDKLQFGKDMFEKKKYIFDFNDKLQDFENNFEKNKTDKDLWKEIIDYYQQNLKSEIANISNNDKINKEIKKMETLQESGYNDEQKNIIAIYQMSVFIKYLKKQHSSIKRLYNPEVRDCYSMTVYKSQGSTINNCYIDLSDIFSLIYDDNLFQRSREIYTAISRAGKEIWFYTGTKCVNCKGKEKVGFGANKNLTLKQLLKYKSGYIDWMKKKNVKPHLLKWIKNYKKRKTNECSCKDTTIFENILKNVT